MVAKSKIKLVQSLKLKKYRQKYNLFVAEGEKIMQSLLKQKKYQIREIYAMGQWLEQHSYLKDSYDLQQVDKSGMKSLSSFRSLPPVLSVVDIPHFENDITPFGKVVYLDGVQDPGNVGTIIRTAEWFGVDAVIRSEDSADFYNPKVIQGTMGSFASIELLTLSREELLSVSSRFGVYAADMGGMDVASIQTPGKALLILSNEGKGLSQILGERADHVIQIPKNPSSTSDSLNVATAAGILIYKLFGA